LKIELCLFLKKYNANTQIKNQQFMIITNNAKSKFKIQKSKIKNQQFIIITNLQKQNSKSAV